MPIHQKSACYAPGLNSSIVIKDQGYCELWPTVSKFADISIKFYPKMAMEFTATVAV